MCKNSLFLALVISFVTLTSCHFGSKSEDMLEELRKKEYNVTFSFSAPVPGATEQTRVGMKDRGLLGVESRWEGNEQLALFDLDQVFVSTNQGGGSSAVMMKYQKAVDTEDHPFYDTLAIDYAEFEGNARVKGELKFENKRFALAFPGSAFGNLDCHSTSAELSFEGQSGTLDNIKANQLFAWGMSLGKLENEKEVELSEGQGACSSNLQWHSHVYGNEKIILDNKMSIIRFSMIYGQVSNVTDTTWMTLQDYLDTQNWQISSIEVADMDTISPLLSPVNLNLTSGEVSRVRPLANGERASLHVTPIGKLPEIKKENATPAVIGGSEGIAWGTTFYLSIPCPLNKSLPIHPLVTVSIVDASGKAVKNLYGSLERKVLKEGDYYMTAPIKLFDDQVKLQEDIKIFLYYHSSFVWGSNNPIEVY